jgi:hypothetical protein
MMFYLPSVNSNDQNQTDVKLPSGLKLTFTKTIRESHPNCRWMRTSKGATVQVCGRNSWDETFTIGGPKECFIGIPESVERALVVSVAMGRLFGLLLDFGINSLPGDIFTPAGPILSALAGNGIGTTIGFFLGLGLGFM